MKYLNGVALALRGLHCLIVAVPNSDHHFKLAIRRKVTRTTKSGQNSPRHSAHIKYYAQHINMMVHRQRMHTISFGGYDAKVVTLAYKRYCVTIDFTKIRFTGV